MEVKIPGKKNCIFFIILVCTCFILFNFHTIGAQTLLSENLKFSDKNNFNSSPKYDNELLSKETEIEGLKLALMAKIERIKHIESQIDIFRKNGHVNRIIETKPVNNLKIARITIKPRIKKANTISLNINGNKKIVIETFRAKEKEISELKKALEDIRARIERITKKIAELHYGIVLNDETKYIREIIRESKISFRNKEKKLSGELLFGQIIDSDTKLPLNNAMVIINGNERGCLTDSLGQFKFTNLKSGLYNITAKLIGYSDDNLESVPVFNGSAKKYILSLKKQPIEFQPVTVYAYRERRDMDNDYKGGLSQILPADYIKQVPGAFDDIFRSFATSPSVNQTNDINGLLYVRGGSSDQNLVLMDGFEVYYPYRMRIAMGGGVSAFDSEIVESIELIPGGFSAQYGNHLSSVLKVKMNGENYQNKSLRFNLNLLTFSSALQLPLNNKGSLVFSTRGSVFGMIANTLLEHNYVLPSFNDLFSKVTYNLSPNNKIMLNVLHASEGTKGTTIASEQMKVINQTQNDNIGLHWQYVLNSNAILSTNASYYLDNNLLQFNDTNTNQYNADLNYNIKKINIKSNLQYHFRPNIKMDLGASAEHSDYLLKWILNWRKKIDVPLNINLYSSSVLLGNYLQFQFMLFNNLSIKLGARGDYSSLNKQQLFSPRFNFSYNFKPSLRVFGAYGDFYQYPNLMSSITRGEPLDISPNIYSLKAEKSTHYILGSEIYLPKDYQLKISGYYKNHDKLLVPENYTTFVATNLGRGYSKGLEFSLGTNLKVKNFMHWQLNYAIAKSRYHSKINSSILPFKWDQPHSLNALLNLNLASNMYIGFRWNYNSGLPYRNQNWQVSDTGPVNFERYPSYNRLDLKFGYSFGSKIRYLFYVDMINLTNKKNIYANNWDFHDSQMSTQTEQNPIYTMPFLLSIGLKLEL